MSNSDSWKPNAFEPTTLIELLDNCLRNCPNRCGYRFPRDNGTERCVTFNRLERLSRATAAIIQQRAGASARVLLAYPAGLDFVCAFFGCVYAGVIPDLASDPGPRRPSSRLTSITRDCSVSLALTMWETLRRCGLVTDTRDQQRAPKWLVTDTVPEQAELQCRPPAIVCDDPALPQYTSGSTSEPEGVIVSHGQLLHNLALIHRGFGLERGARGDRARTRWTVPRHCCGQVTARRWSDHKQALFVVVVPETHSDI